MKAIFKKSRTADGLPLTIGKMYDVLDKKAGKKSGELKEIKVKNDLELESWYSVNKFKLIMEAEACQIVKMAAGDGQKNVAKNVAENATPDGSQIYIGVDMASGTDKTVYDTSAEKVLEESRKELAENLARAFGFQYGA